MKAADWKRLAGPLLADLHIGWSFSRSLAYLGPVDWVVHGVLAEASASQRDEFYLWVVQMPLAVPLGGVVDLSWSDRFGGASATYSADSPVLADAIIGAAGEAIANEREGALLLASPGGADNLRMQEARAYGLFLSGNGESALEVLRRVERYNARYPWECEILDRAGAVAALIESGRTDEAKRQLDAWRLENCESLKIRCA